MHHSRVCGGGHSRLLREAVSRVIADSGRGVIKIIRAINKALILLILAGKQGTFFAKKSKCQFPIPKHSKVKLKLGNPESKLRLAGTV